MSYGYEEGRGRAITMVVVGIAVGALAVGLLWAARVRLDADDGIGRVDPGVVPRNVVTDPSATPAAADSRVDRCREVYDEQAAALAAADTSSEQWEVHIGAMNKLVTGAITLQQATEFWDQTRVGAARNLDVFQEARREFDRRSARCPAPDPTETSPDLGTCAAAVAARNRTLRLAAVSLATWEMHVHHMEMLRMGEMTPDEATQLWLRSWRQGDGEVRAYRAAARTAVGKTC